MNKIPTIFERNWDGNRGVIDSVKVAIPIDAIATEKLDGTNVRITVRNGICVRLEKRCNPTKLQKAKGIEEPWYMDASDSDPQDKWIYDALKNTDISTTPNGEWSGEALGTNIQGNPLNLDKNVIVLFSLSQAPVFSDAPVSFTELKEWLPKQRSKYGKDCGIEGLVWWKDGEPIGKIKLKDFK